MIINKKIETILVGKICKDEAKEILLTLYDKQVFILFRMQKWCMNLCFWIKTINVHKSTMENKLEFRDP